MHVPTSLPTPPALLLDPEYFGTLAAVRCLGRRGIPVVVAGSSRLAFSRWSRFATRAVDAPSVNDPARLLDWLLEFGRREPGHVLSAGSDDLAWLIARHREVLAPFFHLSQAPVAALRLLLDKGELHRLCAERGLLTPRTQFPTRDDEVDALARSATFPLLVKPRSQVLLASHMKGALVHDAAELRARYAAFRRENVPHPELEREMPGGSWPMLQQAHPEAEHGIYSLAGFIGRDGRIVALASRKILQRPRKLGVGLCFEEAEVDGALLAGVASLCARAGYFGPFEVEFIETARGRLLIDFNPRYYSQMAFEIHRGLPLPLLAYEAALGRDHALSALAASPPDTGRAVYVYRAMFELMIRGQALTGRLRGDEARHWRAWQRTTHPYAVDAVLDPDDRRPAMLDGLRLLRQFVRHPRSFIRQVWLDE